MFASAASGTSVNDNDGPSNDLSMLWHL